MRRDNNYHWQKGKERSFLGLAGRYDCRTAARIHIINPNMGFGFYLWSIELSACSIWDSMEWVCVSLVRITLSKATHYPFVLPMRIKNRGNGGQYSSCCSSRPKCILKFNHSIARSAKGIVPVGFKLPVFKVMLQHGLL